MTPRPIASPNGHIHGARHAAQAADPSGDPSSSTNFAQLVANSGMSTMNFVALHQNNDPGNLPSDGHAQRKNKNNQDADSSANAVAAPSASSNPPSTQDASTSSAADCGTDTGNTPAQNAVLAAALAAQSAQNTSGNAAPANPNPSALAGAQLAATPGVDPKQAANQNSNANAPLPPGAADLNARIVAGTPNFLSQSSTVFAGLWHHAGDANAKGTPQDPTAISTPDDSTASSSSATNSGPASNAAITATKTSTTVGAAHTALHDALAANVNADPSDPLTAPPTGSSSNDAPAPQPTLAPAPELAATPLSPANPNPVVPAAMTVMPPLDQVAFSLKQAVQNGTDRIEIQLKPASLGAIDVKLDLTHDGKVTAVISADRSDTLNMLRQDADQLQQALRDAGLQADSNSLSFNLRNDQQSLPQQSSGSSGMAADASDAPITGTSVTPTSRLRRHDGALDIEV